MRTLEERIWENAARLPDKPAVKSGSRQATYRELTRRIAAAAQFYATLPGYSQGRAVLLAAGKQLEFLYAYFGAHLAGLIAVPLAEDTNPTRLAYVRETLKPFASIGFAPGMEGETLRLEWSTFASLDEVEATPDFPAPDAVADVLFTTGTTGAPKGVPLTFGNIAAAASQINAYIRNTEEDVELLALPISHSFGLGRVRCCLANGQTLILLGSFANVKRLFRLLREERVTGFSMVPASWALLRKLSGEALADFAGQLRYIEMGSAPFSADDKRHLAELFPTTRVTMHYGLTEASRSAFMEFHEDDRALASVGRASPNVDIVICDEQGHALPPGEEGEICIRGAHVTRGYLNVPNDATFYGDYFRTGDVGLLSQDGYLYLRSRLKELINVGGKKVAPQEVDEQILKIPGVKDCACVGVPDPEGMLGEVVKACVVKEPGAELTFEDIAAALSSRLEVYKIPTVWAWVEAIPRTQNGKTLRGELK